MVPLPTRGPDSSCSTAAGSGMTARASGWDGSASAASSRSSTSCSWGTTARRSWGPGWTCRLAVRYVITLDADTRLPRGAAIRLVGTMAHPLNRPVFDAHAGRVVEGYAVLQPRVTPTMPTDRDTSLFQRLTAGPAGIDPYAAATSDVYQDLFGGGSYTGKGIYDVDGICRGFGGSRTRECPPQPRPVRGDLRADGTGHRHRALRGVPDGLRGRCGPAASMGARRLAAAALDHPGRRRRRDRIEARSRRSISGRWWTISAALCRLRPRG